MLYTTDLWWFSRDGLLLFGPHYSHLNQPWSHGCSYESPRKSSANWALHAWSCCRSSVRWPSAAWHLLAIPQRHHHSSMPCVNHSQMLRMGAVFLLGLPWFTTWPIHDPVFVLLEPGTDIKKTPGFVWVYNAKPLRNETPKQSVVCAG